VALNVWEKDRLEKVRDSTRRHALEASRFYRDELERRAGSGKMRRPRRLSYERGEYRSREAADYDWFFSLSKAEQSRIRENWMTESSHGEAPDEIEEKIPIREWLDLTRRVDMSRALATGRHVQRDRYGGLNPKSLIAGEPYDPAVLHGGDDQAAHDHISRARREGRLGKHHAHHAGPGVQFFTDKEGIVHPIRRTYETKVQAMRPGDEEAF
jgi:hypothetical protein